MKIAIFILLTFSLNLSFAQKEFNNWYFGEHAGITFNTDPVTTVYDGWLSAYESCSSISDADGNLLFYSNGGRYSWLYDGGVYNRNHELMPNGDLNMVTTMMSSSQQGTVIVPDPGDPNQYYIFTVDAKENAYAGGLRYHKVDMSLDGGLGDVTEKEVPVIIDKTLREGMISIKHANNTDYWVIVGEQETNNFHAILVTVDGLELPITSSTGPVISTFDYPISNFTATSCADFIAYMTDTHGGYLFSFDSSTGLLDDPIILDLPRPYASAFSPNDEILYIFDATAEGFYQLDMTDPDIATSGELVSSVYGGDMRLAPDGKIYFIRNDESMYLGIIENPNTMGIGCNVIEEGLNVGVATFGLPNFYYGESCLMEPNSIKSNEMEKIQFYPNPFQNQLTIGFNELKSNIELTIYSIYGKSIQTEYFKNTQEVLIDVKGESGFYFIEIKDDTGEITTHKVFKFE